MRLLVPLLACLVACSDEDQGETPAPEEEALVAAPAPAEKVEPSPADGPAPGEPPAPRPAVAPDALKVDPATLAQALANPPADLARLPGDGSEGGPKLGAWTMVENRLDENTCEFDPRPSGTGDCLMGCGPIQIEGVEPGYFTLTFPTLSYAGICTMTDGGKRYDCVDHVVEAGMTGKTIGGTFIDATTSEGKWVVEMGCSKPGCTNPDRKDLDDGKACRFSGTFRATRDAG